MSADFIFRARHLGTGARDIFCPPLEMRRQHLHATAAA